MIKNVSFKERRLPKRRRRISVLKQWAQWALGRTPFLEALRSNRVRSTNIPYWFETLFRTYPIGSSNVPYCFVAILFGLLLIGCSESPESVQALPQEEPVQEFTITKGKVFEQTCAVCHGENGEGKRELGAPSIAGMPVWYTKLQIDKFQKGFRGVHPEDIHGQQMRAIALMLDEESLAEAAEKAASLPRIATTSTLPNPPDTTTAKKMYAEKCMICHRWNGSGEVAFRSSPLWGLQDWYHAAQLKKYRDGWRGAHSDDYDGPKMAVIASRLSDEEIYAMAAYLAELAHGDDPREVMER